MHPSPTEVSRDDKTMGMLCHLLSFSGYVVPFGQIIGPLVLWLIKREESAFVDDNGKECINFQISILIWMVCCIPLCFIFVGFVFLFALVITNLVCTIIAAVTANRGQYYRYPLTIRFIK